jgi:methylmalonyl-CoA/ethylmalonyl-CoA epimerase
MSTTTTPMIQRIGQIAINIHDLERAKTFYRDTLGLRHLFDAPPGLSFFDCGGVRLMLSPPEGGRFDHPGSILFLEVADIMEAHRTLVAKGVRFENEPHLIARMPNGELWMAFFEDSEGNPLELMSLRPATA